MSEMGEMSEKSETKRAAESDQVFRVFHRTMRRLRVNQARIRVLETEEAGRVLQISYCAALNTAKRDEELGQVMGAAAYTLVAIDPPVTGGCIIIAHDGNGRQVRQAAAMAQDIADYVGKKIDQAAFARTWLIR